MPGTSEAGRHQTHCPRRMNGARTHEGTDLMPPRFLTVSALLAGAAVTAPAPGPPTVTLAGHKGTLSCLAFSRDGNLLASGAKDGTLIVWDVAARKPLVTLPGHKDMIVGIVFSPDGKTVAATSHDSEVRLYDVATGKPAGTLTGHAKD